METSAPKTPAGRTPRLHEQVASELERRILAGLLEPGLPLFELSLAEEFGVSRAPVRAALHRLEQTGLVRRADKSRSYVVGSSPAAREQRAPPDADERWRKLTAAASWEGIYRDVSRQVLTRAAFGHWRIVETELAAHYGVSRTVAREVLARLEHVGIIRKDSRSRWHLPALTPERVGELYEMRRILEPIALRKASAHVPRPLLQVMRSDLEAAREKLPHQVPPDQLDRLEQQMHVELLSFADNATLLETLQHYHALLVTNAVLYEAAGGSFQSDPFIEEHLSIVHALEAGRPDEAALRLEEHLRVSLGRAIGRIERMVTAGALEPLRYLTPSSEGEG